MFLLSLQRNSVGWLRFCFKTRKWMRKHFSEQTRWSIKGLGSYVEAEFEIQTWTTQLRVRNGREEQIEFVFCTTLMFSILSPPFCSFNMAVLYCKVGSSCCCIIWGRYYLRDRLWGLCLFPMSWRLCDWGNLSFHNTCATGLCIPSFGLVFVSRIFIWLSYLEQSSVGLFCDFGLSLWIEFAANIIAGLKLTFPSD